MVHKLKKNYTNKTGIVMNFISTKHIIILLIVSIIHHQAYAMDKKITCAFNDSNKSIESNLKILKTSKTLELILDENPLEKNKFPIVNVSYDNFSLIHTSMKHIAQNNQVAIKNQYNNIDKKNLVPIIHASSYLDIPYLTKKMINLYGKSCAQEYDLENSNSQNQNIVIKKINSNKIFNDAGPDDIMFKEIFDHMRTVYYESKTEAIEKKSILQSHAKIIVNLQPIKNSKQKNVILLDTNNNPIDTIMHTKDLAIHDDNNKQICSIKYHSGLPYNTFLFAPNKHFLFHCAEKHTFAYGHESSIKGWTCQLINIKTKTSSTIDKVIWSKDTIDNVAPSKDARIIPCFSPDAKYLLVYTYEGYDSRTQSFNGNKYNIIETSSNQTLQTINNDDDKITKIFFCNSDKIFIQQNDKSISFIDINNKKSNVTIENIDDILFNKTKTVCVYCTGKNNFTEIYAHNLHDNNVKTTTININPNDIKLCYDKKNDNFILYETTKNRLIDKIIIYNQNLQSFQTIRLQESLKNISITLNGKQQNNFLIIGTNCHNMQTAFLYNYTTQQFEKILSIKESSLTCDFTASNEHIVYTHNDNHNKFCAKILNIINKKETSLPLGSSTLPQGGSHSIKINPKHPLVYIISDITENTPSNTGHCYQQYSEKFNIYDIGKQKIIASYTTNDMGGIELEGGNTLKYLSKNGQFLALKTAKTIDIINTNTQQKITSFDRSKIKEIKWLNNELFIVDRNRQAEKITFKPMTDTSSLPIQKPISTQKSTLNQSPQDTTTTTPPSNINTQNNNHYMYATGCFCFVTILATICIYYPELFKNLLNILKMYS